MKKYLTIISIINTMLIFSQEGVEIPLNHDTNVEIISGTYLKDLDNFFNPYIGIWEGIWEGKKFTLKIEKNVKEINTQPSGYYFYEDRLIAKYKVTDLSDGNIIEDNLNINTSDLIKIKNLGYGKNEKMWLLYSENNDCGYSCKLLLMGNPSSNQLIYKFFYDNVKFGSNCVDINPDDVPINIPTIDVTLNKI